MPMDRQHLAGFPFADVARQFAYDPLELIVLLLKLLQPFHIGNLHAAYAAGAPNLVVPDA